MTVKFITNFYLNCSTKSAGYCCVNTQQIYFFSELVSGALRRMQKLV